MKKIYFLISLTLIAFSSCNRHDDLDDSLLPNDKNNQEMPKTRGINNKSYHSLGVSYDITDEYLGIDATRALVVDIDAFLKDNPNSYLSNTTTVGENEVRAGATAKDFSEEITKKIKNTNALSGIASWFPTGKLTYESETTTKNTYSSKYSYAQVNLNKRIKRVALNATPILLQKYLYPEFIRDLDLYSPDEFVKVYGTHVLLDITLGGRLQFSYRSEIFHQTNTVEKKKIVEAGIGGILKKLVPFDLSIKSEYINNTTYAEKNGNWEMKVKYIGGETSGMGNISFDSEAGTPSLGLNPSQWENSVNDKNSAIVDVDWNKTYPIFEFIADPTKKAQIKAAVQKYIDDKRIEIIDVAPLYRLFDTRSINAFYTSSWEEAERYLRTYPYWRLDPAISGQYIQGYVFTKQIPGTVPLYRLWNINVSNTWYTTSWTEAQDYMNRFGYKLDYGLEQKGHYIQGYIYKEQQPNTVALYRLFDRNQHNNFYTTSWSEAQYYVNNYKYYSLDPGTSGQYIQGYMIPIGNQ